MLTSTMLQQPIGATKEQEKTSCYNDADISSAHLCSFRLLHQYNL